MTEGIEKAIELEKSNANELYFIDIVADDIEFMPQLKILSEETNAPLLIAVSKANYSEQEHHAALSNGADFYAAYCETPENDIEGVISAINSIKLRARKRKIPNNILGHGDILIVSNQHKAFVKDMELSLTGTEMKILKYLMVNRGNVLSHRQIHRKL